MRDTWNLITKTLEIITVIISMISDNLKSNFNCMKIQISETNFKNSVNQNDLIERDAWKQQNYENFCWAQHKTFQ